MATRVKPGFPVTELNNMQKVTSKNLTGIYKYPRRKKGLQLGKPPKPNRVARGGG